MTNNDFVYTTYIQTTAEKVWAAITNPEFTNQYWAPGIVSDWKNGSTWKQVSGDAKETCNLSGRVVESDPPKRLVLTWVEAANPQDESTVSFSIEAIGEMVRLVVAHGGFKADSKVAPKVANGWPRVLSSLKSLLETGNALNTWAGVVNTCSHPAAEEKAA